MQQREQETFSWLTRRILRMHLLSNSVVRPVPRHFSLVCVLDNLLKGAASQAIQNMNLAFELEDELMGLHDE